MYKLTDDIVAQWGAKSKIGVLNNLRIYNRVQTQAEVQADMNAGI
jgi:hypothetical protein